MDRCVICRKETPYDHETPVQQRKYYVEGAGQLCADCHWKITVTSQEVGRLGLEPLDSDKTYRTYPCADKNCGGTLRALGYVAFAALYQCDECGKRYRR